MKKSTDFRVHQMSTDLHSRSDLVRCAPSRRSAPLALASTALTFLAVAFMSAVAPSELVAQDQNPSGEGEAVRTIPVLVGLDSRIWVDGTSTVRDFTCEAGVVAGNVRVRAAEAPLSLEGLASAVTQAELQIPSGQLDCSNGTMNDHMWEALKTEEHPDIRFTLNDYRVTGTSAESATLELTGALSLAGVTRTRTIDAEAAPGPDGTLRVTGTTRFDQTEHEIEPPSLFFGAMKVRDPVTVGFDLVLDPQQ